jgi:serine/threonine protein kinase
MLYELRGGSLLGAGSYGCVFQPPLLCKGETIQKRKKGLLGKISEPIDFVIEAEAAATLGPLSLPHFVLANVKDACIPSEKQIEPDIAKCKPIKSIGKVVQFTMPYAGKTLFKRIVDNDFTKGSVDFFSLMLQLLEAGAYLIGSGYVHYDVSVNNVVISEKGVVSLIDFGQSFSTKNITQEMINLRWKEYSPEYAAEPPEITLAQGPVGLKERISDVIQRKGGIRDAEKILGLRLVQQEAELRDFWSTSHAVASKDWPTFFKLYWPTFDSWSIGLCLLGALSPLLYKREFLESKAWKEKGPMVKSILRGLLQVNPRKRMDCVQALKLYDPQNTWFEIHGTSWLDSRASSFL